MTIVTFGYGAGCLTSRTSSLVCPPSESSPTLNTNVYVDGRLFSFFHIIQIRWQLGALNTFQMNYGDPNRNHRWIREGSLVEVYVSWGTATPTKYFSGIITKVSRNVSDQRFMVTGSGVNQGLYMRDKKAWDKDYEPLSYNNMRASEILADLIAQVDSIDGLIKPYAGEPSISYEASSGSNILTNFKKVSEYGGYEWFINADGRLIVRESETPSESNAKFNLILGNYNDFTALPDLPYITLHGATLSKDYNSIKNFYKVTGKNGVFGTGFNQFSINKHGRTSEEEYSDDSLISVQSCEVAARKLSEIHGDPKISIPVKIKGNTQLTIGDVVYCDDLDRQIFTSLDNQYLKVFQKNDTISQQGWTSELQIGSPKKQLIDVL